MLEKYTDDTKAIGGFGWFTRPGTILNIWKVDREGEVTNIFILLCLYRADARCPLVKIIVGSN